MKLSFVFGCLVSLLSIVVSGQQIVTNSSSASSIISQYGSTFSNAGGSILHDKVNVYVIFYGNWSSTQSQTEQDTFLSFIENISSSSWFSILKQYTDKNGKSVTGPLNLVAAVNDAGSNSLNVTNSIHKQIVLDAVKSGYLSTTNSLDSNGVYIIMGGSDVSDDEFCKVNCGYNSYSDEFQYMFIGYPGICPDTCMPSFNKDQSPNNSPAMDAAITIFSHEIQDILTDPRDNGWEISTSNSTIELGDFCSLKGTSSYQFGNVTQTSSGSYNLELDNNKYLVQTIFDLSTQQCSLGK